MENKRWVLNKTHTGRWIFFEALLVSCALCYLMKQIDDRYLINFEKWQRMAVQKKWLEGREARKNLHFKGI